jgi:signal transduction histidine kinase/BarA-like signal transduction histidine kinase
MEFLNLLDKANKKNTFLYWASGYVGLFAHPLYWYIWTYIYPGFYESTFFRFLCSAVSIPVILLNFWPARLKTYFPIYWFFFLMLQLPITFTYLTLMNKFTGMWLICETMMILVLAVFYQRFILYFLNLTIGITIAIIIYLYNATEALHFNDEFIVLLIPLPMAIFCILIFNHALNKGKVLEETNEILKSLGGSIAHEIRNPLNSILVAVEEIEGLHKKEDPLGLKTIMLTKICKELINNGNSIINITLQNIQGKPIDSSQFVILSFKQCMYWVLDSYAFRSGERSKVTFKDNYDFNFKGDASLFSYMMFNLLKNALYYLKSYPESTIEIKSHHINGKNLVCFRDTGPGIPADIIPKLFDNFATFGKSEGTGLGLPFCKRVMDSFGGSIYCRSVQEQYTEFILTFPSCEDALPIEADQDAVKSVNASVKTTWVLLVDDDITSSTITSKYLIRSGVQCDVAENGQVALDMLTMKDYQAVFMDLQMPVMNGIEATKKIRLQDKFQDLVIIGLTGTSSETEIQTALDCGMNDCLTKPIRREQLIEKLNDFFKRLD